MVSVAVGSDVPRTSDMSLESFQGDPVLGNTPRASAQSEVAAICLESEWQAHLKSKGWSSGTAALLPSAHSSFHTTNIQPVTPSAVTFLSVLWPGVSLHK